MGTLLRRGGGPQLTGCSLRATCVAVRSRGIWTFRGKGQCVGAVGEYPTGQAIRLANGAAVQRYVDCRCRAYTRIDRVAEQMPVVETALDLAGPGGSAGVTMGRSRASRILKSRIPCPN